MYVTGAPLNPSYLNYYRKSNCYKSEDSYASASSSVSPSVSESIIDFIEAERKRNGSKISRNSKILINVSGERYETFEATLNKYPETLLGTLEKRSHLIDKRSDEIFLNRHREAFEAILFYYQSSGVLVRPTNIPMKDFVEECYFYDICEQAIKRMQCREGYLHKQRKTFPSSEKYKEFMRSCWTFLDRPRKFENKYAFWYFLMSYLMMLLSVAIFCFETQLRLDVEAPEMLAYRKMILHLEVILSIYFALEYLLRFYVYPHRAQFWTEPINSIELLAIFPFLLICLFPEHHIKEVTLNVTRLFRIYRILRLSYANHAVNVATRIFKVSISHVIFVLISSLLLCTFCGSVMYIIESTQDKTKFTSIPQSMWWAVQSVLGVGYGDIVPTSLVGKIVAPVLFFYGLVFETVLVLSLGAIFCTMYMNELQLNE